MIALQPDPARFAVVVTLTNVQTGTTVTRDTGDGPEPVRGMVDLAAGDHVLTDRECPFGVPAIYRADGDTATTQLDVTRPVLSHPYIPLAVTVTLENDTPQSWDAAGTVHSPLDGGSVTVTYVPRRILTGNLRVPLADNDVTTLGQLFSDSAPLLLRTPPGCPVSDRWLWAETVTRTRPAADYPLSWIDIPYVRVAPPGATVAPPVGWDWTAVPVAFATWAEITAPTWLALLSGPGPYPNASRWGW